MKSDRKVLWLPLDSRLKRREVSKNH